MTDYTAAQYRAAFGRTVDTLIQAGTPDSEKIILVWAAGNSNGRRDAQGNLADASSPNLSAATPYYFPELRGHFISVVATGQLGAIAEYSNRCGVAADYCIAAPGSGIYGPAAGSSGNFLTASGTSLATPQVAGALALMEEAFRGQLGSTEMVSRLFAAANKSGIYADRETYGQGLLDVEKATRPIGTARASLGHRLDGPAAALQRTVLAAGPAWGDALKNALAGRELTVFDSLDAPFFIPMERFIASWPLDGDWRADQRFVRFLNRASQAGWNSTAIAGGWTVGSARGLASAPPAGEGNWSALDRLSGVQNAWIAQGTQGVGMARNFLPTGARSRLSSGFFVQNAGATRGEPLTVPGRSQGAFLNLDVEGGRHRISAELGLLHESDRLLGTGAGGAWGQLAGNTWFTRLVAERKLGSSLSVVAVAQGGITSTEASHGLLRSARRVRSSAYAAGIHWQEKAPDNTQRIWLLVSQPLRNESGTLQLDYPAGRTRAGSVLRQTASLSVEPSGRQLDFTLGYETAMPGNAFRDRGWRIRIEAWRSHEPGHRARARPENALYLAVARSFNAS